MPFESHLRKTAPPLPPGQAPAHYWPAWLAALGRRLDQIAQRSRDASLSHLPLPSNAADSIDAVGADRQLPRAPSESNTNYASYLKDAWTAWGGDDTPGVGVGGGGGGGSPLGLLVALQRADFPTGADGATIVTQGGRYYQLIGDALAVGDLDECVNRVDLHGVVVPRPGWTFDGRDNFYSVFGIVFPEDTAIDAAKLNRIVELWRQANELYVGCWVIGTGRILGWPSAQLGDGRTLGGNNAAFIPPGTGDDTRIRYTFILP